MTVRKEATSDRRGRTGLDAVACSNAYSILNQFSLGISRPQSWTEIMEKKCHLSLHLGSLVCTAAALSIAKDPPVSIGNEPR
jgi:hypothetical protein